jgi:hypothetical protein
VAPTETGAPGIRARCQLVPLKRTDRSMCGD